MAWFKCIFCFAINFAKLWTSLLNSWQNFLYICYLHLTAPQLPFDNEFIMLWWELFLACCFVLFCFLCSIVRWLGHVQFTWSRSASASVFTFFIILRLGFKNLLNLIFVFLFWLTLYTRANIMSSLACLNYVYSIIYNLFL